MSSAAAVFRFAKQNFTQINKYMLAGHRRPEFNPLCRRTCLIHLADIMCDKRHTLLQERVDRKSKQVITSCPEVIVRNRDERQ